MLIVPCNPTLDKCLTMDGWMGDRQERRNDSFQRGEHNGKSAEWNTEEQRRNFTKKNICPKATCPLPLPCPHSFEHHHLLRKKNLSFYDMATSNETMRTSPVVGSIRAWHEPLGRATTTVRIESLY